MSIHWFNHQHGRPLSLSLCILNGNFSFLWIWTLQKWMMCFWRLFIFICCRRKRMRDQTSSDSLRNTGEKETVFFHRSVPTLVPWLSSGQHQSALAACWPVSLFPPGQLAGWNSRMLIPLSPSLEPAPPAVPPPPPPSSSSPSSIPR